jgi:magnesium chelatase subunit D
MALVADAYQRRDRVALVVFHGGGAQVLLRPTSSTEVALGRLRAIPTGGRTPLWAGIDAARRLAVAARRGQASPLVVVVSDGRATAAPAGQDPVVAAMEAARAVAASRLEGLVVDCEGPGRRLGVTLALAEAMGARHVAMPVGEGEQVGRALARSIVEALG